MAVLAASLVSVATSVPRSAHLRYDPPPESILFERDGIIVYAQSAHAGAVAAYTQWDGQWPPHGFSLACPGEHLDALFHVTNAREKVVHLVTSNAELRVGKATSKNAMPSVVELRPGATLQIYERFDWPPDDGGGAVHVVLGEVELDDGRRIRVEMDLTSAPEKRGAP